MTSYMWFIRRAIKWFVILVCALALVLIAFLYLAPTFGGTPAGESLKRIQASPNTVDQRFVNTVDTVLDTRAANKPMDISTYFFPPEGKNPTEPLPSVKFNASEFSEGEFVWMGHSTVLLNDSGLLILTDPIFNRASPVPFIGNPFPLEHKPRVEDLPPIDVVIISHDHYDHLDHLTIASLAHNTKRFLVPLGIAAHLQRWGVPANKITELDWYESTTINSTTFTLTPARHFSGRGISNRNQTLWGSWVISSDTVNLFFSGDTGYFNELKKIGLQYGPFDIAFIENGAYSRDWSQVHMMPEQAVQATLDLQADLFFPIHWSKFDLAQHQWNEPVIRALSTARQLNVSVATPKIGQVFTLQKIPQQHWWRD